MSDIRDENDRLRDGDLPSDPLDDARPMVDGDAAPVPYIIPQSITDHAHRLIEGNRNRRAHYLGRGKTRTGDRTGEAYDLTVAYEVLDAGGTLPDAAGALMDRPDGHARARGEAYIRDVLARVVAELEHERQLEREEAEHKEAEREDRKRQRAEERAEEARERKLKKLAEAQIEVEFAREHIDFGPVRVHTTTPPRYIFTINGREVSMDLDEVASPRRFKLKVFGVLHRLLPFPTRQSAWDELINSLLSDAEFVSEAATASPAEIMEEEIDNAIEEMPVTDSAELDSAEDLGSDLKRGVRLILDGLEWVSSLVLRRKVATTVSPFDPELWASTMTQLGWRQTRYRRGGHQFRVWCRELAESAGDPPDQAAAA